MKKAGKPSKKHKDEFSTSMDPISFNDLYGRLGLVDSRTRRPRHDGIRRYERSWNIFSILCHTLDKDEKVFLDVSHDEFLKMYCFQVSAANKNIADWFIKKQILTKEYAQNIPKDQFEEYKRIVEFEFKIDIYQLISKEQFNYISAYLDSVFYKEIDSKLLNQEEY